MTIIDGALTDWPAGSRLDTVQTGAPGYGLYGMTDADFIYLAITSADATIGAGTTIWLDTDLDRTNGYQIWGWTGGIEYHVEIGADNMPMLFAGGPGGAVIEGLTFAYSATGDTLELRIDRAAVGNPAQFRIFSDVNNAVFLPNDYANVNFIVGDPPAPPGPVVAGGKTLDGDLSEWGAGTRLDTASTGHTGYALHGDLQQNVLTFAIGTDGTPIGTGTTIWLDSDLDTGTGYQIWGFTGGAEYNLNMGADGKLRLYTGGAGETLVGDVQYALNAEGSVLEVAIDASLLGSPSQVHVLADVNDSIFLPNSYSTSNFIVGQPPSVQIGNTTINGVIDAAEWTMADTLVAGDDRLLGRAEVTAAGTTFVLAIASNAAAIGAETTIWIDSDRDTTTGHQIWGWAGGAEYNVNIAADGTARLYSGGAGETFVSDLTYRLAADGSGFEVAIASDLLAGSPQSIRVLADVNNSVFLPGAYAGANLVISTPTGPAVDDPGLRIGIVYSETTAQNYYNLTNYGQLFMAAQNQAMQAGIPFDLLTEADLLNPLNLAVYDALVFPGFSHVKAGQVDAIAASLATAASAYGVGLITAGNFLTNDETGSALAGNSYARMQSLLGVTLEGFGQTNGIQMEATAAGQTLLGSYSSGQQIGAYGNLSYLSFTDVTPDGNGQTLFDQIVTDESGNTLRLDGVIATTTAARNVHFATDALLGNNNVLGSALDWVATDNAPDVSLNMTRGSSLFYARNDMDQAMESSDVGTSGQGIYDKMLPIVESWHNQWGFVGSYYIDIGANPPDQSTDWTVSGDYYQRLIALESEVGSHSYTHPDDTNLLSADTPAILALAARVDPRNPGAVDPSTLTQAEQNVLFNSYRFQFETSKLIIEDRLGMTITGAAVPGAPESVDTSREIIQYYEYLSGGYSGIGAGYPGAFGFLTPGETEKVYLAPNVSFDFSLVEFQGLTPAQAADVWLREYAAITGNANAPIIAFPWHDYGATTWFADTTYSLDMYEAIISAAAADGTEFVTGVDLAHRIESFQGSALSASRSNDVITAQVTSTDAGHFALDVTDEGRIASVANWYAYNDHAVFVPRNGGTFEISLGAQTSDVTHVAELAQRAELISVWGDGQDLDFVFNGRGDTVVDLATQGSQWITVTGVDNGQIDTTGNLVLTSNNLANHAVGIDYSTGTGEFLGTAADELLIGGSANDTIRGQAGKDILIGNAGNDVLAGGAGDDVLSGGSGTHKDLTGGIDTFVFEAGGGNDSVLDFTSGIDILHLIGLGFADAVDAAAQFAQTTDGLLLTFGSGSSLLLADLAFGDVTATDIRIFEAAVA
ncbi:serralysin [Loktanella salsilacus]|uniref:Serralysin n=1 Tax=Loktanella salsilacus TaxID=195913 RepID=A0A1I4JIJ7_9RHOB|nr:hypothetical protein [Loktanella salsilacus]SFL66382.1 serralysin [Loktanella salsilacus]